MSIPELFSIYAAINASVILSYIGLACAPRLQLRAKHLLKVSYTGIVLMLSLALVQAFCPHRTFFQPPVKIWAASSLRPLSSLHLTKSVPVVAVPVLSKGSDFRLDRLTLAVEILLFLAILLLTAAALREFGRMLKLRKSSFLIRRRGQLLILASDSISVPISFWLPFRSMVVIPNHLIADRSRLTMAIFHEIQHHRQRDTQWIYILRLLQYFCFANPFVHLWARKLSELQEFACDEMLVDRGKVSPQAYARCLLQVAETALTRDERLACATGLTFRGEGNFLKRRIARMLNSKARTNRSLAVVWAAIFTLSMGCAAWASQGLVRDRQISLKQARAMARNTGEGFPVPVNPMVLAELNRYLGTPGGREFIQNSLNRMERYRPLIESKIEQYGVPRELMAIPLVESGYQNLPPKPDISHSAGIWQFVQPTAWLYTLNVWPPVDERLDPEKETDAAMRLLLSDKIRFGSWDLSILAYNAGEKIVSKGILKTKSHDAWTLIQKGYEGDHGYLARVMAAVLILKNPDLLKL